MTAYECVTCGELPGIDGGPLDPVHADEHEALGHDVRRLPDEREQRGGPHGPPLHDPEGERDGLAGRATGEVSVWRGERVGRRRSDY